MIKYEVNLEINANIIDEYLAWLKPHITAILALDGFLKAELLFDKFNEHEEVKNITVAYYLRDFGAYERYIALHAARMRDEGIAKFEGLFKAYRRVFEVADTYGACS